MKTLEQACREKNIDLKSIEDELHIHVHLENSILYPKAFKF